MNAKQKQVIKRRELRNKQTEAETLVWLNVRNRRLSGYRFVRQYSVGRYVVDFYCQNLKLAIEIDGPIHNLQRDYDEERDGYLDAKGIKVLRFTNDEVTKSTKATLKSIHLSCQAREDETKSG